MKKKKILFVIESLGLAGSEKSLIALLRFLDPDKYSIDLQLFRFGGELEEFIPEYVKLLPGLEYNDFVKKPLFINLFSGKWKLFFAKLRYSFALRLNTADHSNKAKMYWDSVRKVFPISIKKYDVAIAYAQGVPTFYVADCISAEKKITWVNANVQFAGKNLEFQRKYYAKFDAIVPVSAVTCQNFSIIFPEYKKKTRLLADIIDYKMIVNMSASTAPTFNREKFNILTVARLEKGMKGLDIAVNAAKILHDQNVSFHWYFLGKGSYQEEMVKFIKEHHLDNQITLLGTTANPYPFFKAATLYVQTSRSESYGISIAEARLLNLPIVTTQFDTVYAQMVHEKNGLVTDINAAAVAEGIIRMMADEQLYLSVLHYLRNESKENLETIKRFDVLIEELFSESKSDFSINPEQHSRSQLNS